MMEKPQWVLGVVRASVSANVHDHLPVRVRRRITDQLPDVLAHFGLGHAKRGQNPLPSCGQSTDQAGDRRVGGHRPEYGWLRPQHAHIGEAVPGQRDRESDVQEDLPRVVDGPVLAPRVRNHLGRDRDPRREQLQ